jgi:Ca2+-binding EF-hand superfamily protein
VRQATQIIRTDLLRYTIFPFLRNLVLPGDTLSEEEVMMLINAADRDGDGSLDFEEFVKIMMG